MSPRTPTRFSLALTLFAALVTSLAPVAAGAQDKKDEAALPTIEKKTEGMEKRDGFLPLYWDSKTGKMWLEIGRLGEELLYYPSLPAGLGQNDIGLNRGDLGRSHVVAFRRVGPRVLMEEPNYWYRAVSDRPMERRSVDDGFPTSILWGFKVEAATEERVLVDATDFFLHDQHGVATTLQRTNQGTFRPDASRAAFYLPRTKVFPENTEVEVTLTFTSDQPGGLVRTIAPTGQAITVRQHHSFVALPALDGSFEPRRADPRAGYFGIAYMDYAQPINEDLQQRLITRHRIQKKDPSAAMSEPVEPIVYYLDPGTPEPVRSALLEGGRWWNQAFEAAGFIDGFRMEVLPDTADPMDARYNVVQWVHRSTRGWSYGNSIADPRTGEILKGHVTLGSLRVRQDYLIGEGLTAPYLTGDENPADVEAMALQRIRQLSAHEIGHTLGLAHNYISSAQKEHGVQSVMDYPQPVVTLEDGRIHLGRDSYGDEIGAWDKVAIRYGYTQFADGTDEDQALQQILLDAIDDGISFLTDQDARPAGSAHPTVHLWDNGANAADELDRMMDVRRAALDRFGEAVIKPGEPLATLEEALVPVFMYHRYQTQAAAKIVAGQYYTYALRGDGQAPLSAVPAREQERALDALLRTVRPTELAIPRSVLAQLPPRPHRFDPHGELFRRQTGLVFDAISPAVAAASFTFQYLLDTERSARMIQQKALDTELPGLLDVMERVTESVFDGQPGDRSGDRRGGPNGDRYLAEIDRAVQRAYVDRLLWMAGRAPNAQVRAEVQLELTRLQERLDDGNRGDDAYRAHARLLASDIARFLSRPHADVDTPDAPSMPPGDPIGAEAQAWLDGAGGFRIDLTCPWDRERPLL